MDAPLSAGPAAPDAAYDGALRYLFARTTGSIKPGLERTHALLDRLGRPQERFRAVHVAGTNGKGSVCAALEALLRARGLRVGKYTSPHLVDFRERVVVDGAPVSREAVVEFVRRWTPVCEALGATFFEATTALAFAAFADAAVDVAVIETGLGGRLDSTNVLHPLAAAVTTVGLDHTEYLGNTTMAIAAEKAGIYKAGVPAVVGEFDPALRARLAELAARAGAAPVHVVAEQSAPAAVEVRADGTHFEGTWRGERLPLRTALLGVHQARNAAVALATLDLADRQAGGGLAPERTAIAEALARVRLPGRFQRVDRWIFDVAHNPDGAEVLARTLRLVSAPRPVVAVLGVLSDKDWRGMMHALAPVVERFVVTLAPTAPAGRVWDPAAAVAYAAANGWAAELCPDFDDALRVAAMAPTALVTGSFHTVGDALSRLHLSPLSG